MSQNPVLTAVEKPSRRALEEAISCFDANASNKTAEQITKAMLAIVGEACSLLSEGKTQAETVASLARSGLSEECSAPFVEKAVSIVEWNQQAQQPAPLGKPIWAWVAAGLVLLVIAFAVSVGST